MRRFQLKTMSLENKTESNFSRLTLDCPIVCMFVLFLHVLLGTTSKGHLGWFRLSQLVSRDFPDCKEIGHTMKGVLGKNVAQFGCVLSELMRSCYDSGESDEVRIFVE